MKTENVSELQRLAEIGKMSGGFIHDLANQITVMSLSMDRVEKSRKNIRNFINAMTKHMRGKDIRCYFSLEKKLRELVELFRFKAEKEDIRLSISVTDNAHGLKIYGSRIRFNQVFSNLLSNAIDSFHKADGEQIRTVDISVEIKSGTAVICVTDSGTGIGPRVLKKVFEPFFTTKPVGKGMGLGLSTVKDIVENEFRGSILLKSELGVGTKFTVFIPQKFSKI